MAAALYWFDCRHRGRPIAYLYAIATQRALQKKGLCRALMTNTHVHLRQLGYAGCMLVPANSKLAKMY